MRLFAHPFNNRRIKQKTKRTGFCDEQNPVLLCYLIFYSPGLFGKGQQRYNRTHREAKGVVRPRLMRACPIADMNRAEYYFLKILCSIAIFLVVISSEI